MVKREVIYIYVEFGVVYGIFSIWFKFRGFSNVDYLISFRSWNIKVEYWFFFLLLTRFWRCFLNGLNSCFFILKYGIGNILEIFVKSKK